MVMAVETELLNLNLPALTLHLIPSMAVSHSFCLAVSCPPVFLLLKFPGLGTFPEQLAWALLVWQPHNRRYS